VDIAAGATLDVNGFNDTIRGIAGAGTIDNTGASNAVLIIGANGASGSFSGVIQDTAGNLLLQKNGAGTNLLSNAASTWNGGLFINAGVIEFTNNHVFGSGPVIVGAGGTLANLGSRSITNLLLGTNSGTATLNTSGGDLSLPGVVTFDGPEFAKSGANTLTIAPSAVVSLGTASGFDLNGGNLLIDGASWTHANDGFRMRATTNFPTVSVTMQNNASVTIGGGANLQLGNTADTNLTTLTRVTNVFNLVSGTLTMGTASINVGAFIGNAGVFIQSAGTVTSTNLGNNNGLVLGAATNSSGVYELNGGTLVTARVRKTGTNETFARFVFGGGTLRALNNNAAATTNFMSGLDEAVVRAAGARIDTDAFDIDIGQSLTEDPSSTGGGLFKSGSGALALNGASTYTGPTVVSNGVLRGRGSVPTSVTGAGRIGGGDRDELGTFTINGNSTATGGAVMRLNKTGVVLTNDRVVVTGTLNLSGDLSVTATGDALASGDSFDLFDAGTFAGNFSTRSLPVLPPGLSWDTSTVNTTGVIRVVTSPAVTSITYGPGTVQIVGTGDAALAGQNYRVLSSTDMALPYTSWSVVFTGVFDGSGNFDTGTFAVTPSDTRRFYVVVYP
jgi:autotransporter-associated beta strand protein